MAPAHCWAQHRSFSDPDKQVIIAAVELLPHLEETMNRIAGMGLSYFWCRLIRRATKNRCATTSYTSPRMKDEVETLLCNPNLAIHRAKEIGNGRTPGGITLAVVPDKKMFASREDIAHRCLVTSNIDRIFAEVSPEMEAALLQPLASRTLEYYLREIARPPPTARRTPVQRKSA